MRISDWSSDVCSSDLHGTASVVLMAGGAVRGGRVVADWPGLSRQALFEGRDLRPTTDLQALLARVISEHFALDPALVGRSFFPGSLAEHSWQIGRASSRERVSDNVLL